MQKLLFIPLDWHLNAQPDLYKAFCQHFETHHYQNMTDAIAFGPEIIYVQCGAIAAGVLIHIKKTTGAKVIQWTGNCRHQVVDEALIYKDIADISFLAQGLGQKQMYEQALGHPVFYLQHGMAEFNFISPIIWDNPATTTKKIRFVANNYSEFPGAVERTQLAELLTHHFLNFEIWGNGYADGRYRNPDSISYYKTPELYNNSYIAISANSFNDVEGYWCNRTLDIMAAGCCCLKRYVPGAEQFFKDMEHVVFYHSNDQAVEKLNLLINNVELRNKIAVAAQQLVKEKHTLAFRAYEIKEALNGNTKILSKLPEYV